MAEYHVKQTANTTTTAAGPVNDKFLSEWQVMLMPPLGNSVAVCAMACSKHS